MKLITAVAPKEAWLSTQDAGNHEEPAAPGLAPVTDILMVDDREDKLLALDATLSSLGQNLVKARSGKEALRLLLKQDFAVILLDVSMPGMDGFETAALIRTRQKTEHTPIIFVTAFGNSETHVSRGYSLGAVDYIVAPIIPEILRAKVSVFVELHRKSELIKRQAQQIREAEQNRFRAELAGVADRLEAETKRNRFFTLSLDMLGITDLEGRLLQVNPSWEEVFGYGESELRHLTLGELVHPEEKDEVDLKFEQLRKGSRIPYCEGRLRHKDGTYRWLGWTAASFLSEKLIYLFCRDITAKRVAEERIVQLNAELAHQVAALTEVNQELEAFNYSISHDLRTPLRGMTSFANALLEQESSKLSPEGIDFAHRIVRSAKYMDTLLRDLLAYSRLSREQMPLAPVKLENAVQELVEVLAEEIRQREARIEVVPPLGTALSHAPTLRQVLANLIGNALKFVPAGRTPQIRVTATQANGLIRLSVEDNGIGIKTSYQERIFGLFERLPDAAAYPGTGVGLALVRKGAERMGGHVGVESEPGRGSKFWLDLKCEATAQA